MKYFVDRENHFIESFSPATGKYFRTGVLDADNKDTGVDPFMRCFPNLIDIGIMGRCVCANQCKVDCYQRAIDRHGNSMSLADYQSIMDQSENKVFSVALGGAGDPDTHENFREIMEMTRDYGIVPNFTTSGIAFTKEKVCICKELAGAVAVSEHNADYTHKAVNMLLDAGVKTNVHYVLSNESIDLAIQRLRSNYYGNLNAVVFLLYKPIGLGRMDKVLRTDDPRLAEFFRVVDDNNCTHKIGFDSCTAPGILNHCEKVDMDSIDFCEGGRFSMYIDADMNAMPCSFGNQDKKWHVSLRDHTIKEAWESDVFNSFRKPLNKSCQMCMNRAACAGGCPISREIVLCDRKEKELV